MKHMSLDQLLNFNKEATIWKRQEKVGYMKWNEGITNCVSSQLFQTNGTKRK